MQLIAAAHRVMNGLMAELKEGHLRDHVLEPQGGDDPREAADELMDKIAQAISAIKIHDTTASRVARMSGTVTRLTGLLKRRPQPALC
jgi:glucose-6-phosphate-specific signal transduction histidine kinase